MNNYLVIKDAVEQFEITQYALRKAIKNGQVRHFVTKLLPMNIPVMMVYAEDIKTYKLLSEGDFVPIHFAGSRQRMTQRRLRVLEKARGVFSVLRE